MKRQVRKDISPLLSAFDTKKFGVVASILLTITVIDMVFSFAATATRVSADWEIVLLIVLSCVYGMCQYLILKFIKQKSKQIRDKVIFFNVLNTFVEKIQYLLILFIGIIVLEIITTSHYHTALLNWGSTINYAIGGTAMGILAASFLSWYRSIRSYVVLLYGIATAVACIAFTIFLVYNSIVLFYMPAERNPQSSPSSFQLYSQDSPMWTLQYHNGVVNFVTVLLLWVSSAIMLHQHSQKLGKIKFWSIMIIPALFFVIQPTALIFPYIPTILGISSQDVPLYVTMLYTVVPGILGGLLFAAPFLAIARSIPKNTILREYLIITVWGFILFNVTTSANVLLAPYLPFGFLTVSLVGSSTYLILVGLYCSAISISVDASLRRSIKKSLLDESRLLDSIGSAHMEQETIRKITKIAKEQQSTIVEETGVQSSFEESDMKKYLEDVIEEVHKHRS
jgi:hypothetical protein